MPYPLPREVVLLTFSKDTPCCPILPQNHPMYTIFGCRAARGAASNLVGAAMRKSRSTLNGAGATAVLYSTGGNGTGALFSHNTAWLPSALVCTSCAWLLAINTSR